MNRRVFCFSVGEYSNNQLAKLIAKVQNSLHVTYDWTIAEDAPRQAYVELVQQGHSNDDIGKYLMSRAFSRAKDMVDKKERETPTDKLEQLSDEHQMQNESSHELSIDPRGLKALRECIERLPVQNRELLESHYFNLISQKELGEQFQIRNVHQRFADIRNSLEKCLEGKGYLGDNIFEQRG